jgi:hypothetical protein
MTRTRLGIVALALLAGVVTLQAQGQNVAWTFKSITFNPQAQTCASTGNGSAQTLSFTPANTSIKVTQNDPDGCAVTLGETNIPDGREVDIINLSSNALTFATSAGVQVVYGGSASLAQNQLIHFKYVSASGAGAGAWVEQFRSNAATGTVDLTTSVTGILPGANGGTGNGFFAVTGPTTSLKTFTFPNASSTVLTTNAAVTVAQGGTGATTFTANLPLLGNGTSAVAQGTRSGNTTSFATTTGSFTTGNCVKVDVNGNFVDHGSACGTGGSATGLLVESGGESKITDLSADASPTTDDLVVTVNDPGGTPANRKVTVGNLVALASGLSSSIYLQYRDEKTQNTAGGTFTSGAWRTRTLNTEVSDVGALGSLSSNQITLTAGTYVIRATAPAWTVNRHQARLQNVTDATTVLIGTAAFSSSSGTGAMTESTISGVFTIGASKALELQHQCQTTEATDGFGVGANFTTEVYTVVELWKIG